MHALSGVSRRVRSLVLLLLAFGCGGSEDGGEGADRADPDAGGGRLDTGPGPEGEGEGEGEAAADGWPALAELRWRSEPASVDGLPASLRLAAAPGGAPVALAYLLGGEIVESCDLGSSGRTFPVRQWSLRHRLLGPAAAAEQTLVTSDVSFGLGFAMTADGTSLLALPGGDHGRQFCGGSDLLLVSGPPWAERTVQADSATGATCRAMQDVCNRGDVTGLWPALAVRGERRLLAFQDIHFGFTREDWDSADLEVAEGASWAVSTADDSQGAGVWSSAAIGEDGTLAVAFCNPKRGGIWLSSKAPGGEPAGWQTAPVTMRNAGSPPSLAARPGGGFGIAFQDEVDKVLLLAECGPGEPTNCPVTPVDERATTGGAPQLAYTSAGRAVLAYRQCHRQTGQSQCAASYDGVWLAVRAPGRSDRWERRELANDPDGLDGESLAMVLPGGDGLPVLAYTLARYDPVARQTEQQVVVLVGELAGERP